MLLLLVVWLIRTCRSGMRRERKLESLRLEPSQSGSRGSSRNGFVDRRLFSVPPHPTPCEPCCEPRSRSVPPDDSNAARPPQPTSRGGPRQMSVAAAAWPPRDRSPVACGRGGRTDTALDRARPLTKQLKAALILPPLLRYQTNPPSGLFLSSGKRCPPCRRQFNHERHTASMGWHRPTP